MTRVRAIARDARGATIVEFALVAPVLLLTIFGFADMIYTQYTRSVLEGAVQKAGRDSAIEGSAAISGTIDDRVMDAVRRVASNASYRSTRTAYDYFGDVDRKERFYDNNGNGTREWGECYVDANNDNRWDDPGRGGQGNASDAVLYKMEITFPHLFPMGVLGWPANQTMTAKTILKNQPFSTQNVSSRPVRCF